MAKAKRRTRRKPQPKAGNSMWLWGIVGVATVAGIYAYQNRKDMPSMLARAGAIAGVQHVAREAPVPAAKPQIRTAAIAPEPRATSALPVPPAAIPVAIEILGILMTAVQDDDERHRAFDARRHIFNHAQVAGIAAEPQNFRQPLRHWARGNATARGLRLRLRHWKLELRQLYGINEQAAKPARNFKIHHGPFYPRQPQSVFLRGGRRALFLSRSSEHREIESLFATQQI